MRHDAQQVRPRPRHHVDHRVPAAARAPPSGRRVTSCARSCSRSAATRCPSTLTRRCVSGSIRCVSHPCWVTSTSGANARTTAGTTASIARSQPGVARPGRERDVDGRARCAAVRRSPGRSPCRGTGRAPSRAPTPSAPAGRPRTPSGRRRRGARRRRRRPPARRPRRAARGSRRRRRCRRRTPTRPPGIAWCRPPVTFTACSARPSQTASAASTDPCTTRAAASCMSGNTGSSRRAQPAVGVGGARPSAARCTAATYAGSCTVSSSSSEAMLGADQLHVRARRAGRAPRPAGWSGRVARRSSGARGRSRTRASRATRPRARVPTTSCAHRRTRPGHLSITTHTAPGGTACRGRAARRARARVAPIRRAPAGRRGGVMARGGPGVAWRAREIVDRSARQSPARLALGVFALVIAMVTVAAVGPVGDASAVSGRRSSTRCSPPRPPAPSPASSSCPPASTGPAWGLVVILVAIQIGGLGVMTLASLLGMAVSRRIGLTQRLLVSSETKETRLGEVGSLDPDGHHHVRRRSSWPSPLVLFPRFLMFDENVGEAAWHSIFYAISAFNNAGFVPTPDGLAPFVSDWWVLMPIIVGVFIGSLGLPRDPQRRPPPARAAPVEPALQADGHHQHRARGRRLDPGRGVRVDQPGDVQAARAQRHRARLAVRRRHAALRRASPPSTSGRCTRAPGCSWTRSCSSAAAPRRPPAASRSRRSPSCCSRSSPRPAATRTSRRTADGSRARRCRWRSPSRSSPPRSCWSRRCCCWP